MICVGMPQGLEAYDILRGELLRMTAHFFVLDWEHGEFNRGGHGKGQGD